MKKFFIVCFAAMLCSLSALAAPGTYNGSLEISVYGSSPVTIPNQPVVVADDGTNVTLNISGFTFGDKTVDVVIYATKDANGNLTCNSISASDLTVTVLAFKGTLLDHSCTIDMTLYSNLLVIGVKYNGTL